MKNKTNQDLLRIGALGVIFLVMVCIIGGSIVFGNMRTAPARADQPETTEAPVAEPMATEALALVPPVEPQASEADAKTTDPVTEAPAPVIEPKSLVDLNDGMPTVTQNVIAGFPNEYKVRAEVRYPGDVARFIFTFDEDFEHLVILRAIADDRFTKAVAVINGKETDLLPLLDMCVVDGTFPKDATRRAYMEARGVSLEGEQLAQNCNTVFLGNVTTKDQLIIEVQDDESLQVNRGVNLSLSTDTDPLTVDLTGAPVAPTFVLEGFEPAP